MTVTQQKIQFEFSKEILPTPPGVPSAGATPLAIPPPGQSLQQTHSGANGNKNWQPIARANKVEQPRFLPPDKPLDLNPPRRS